MIYSREDAVKHIEKLKIESAKIIEEFKIYFSIQVNLLGYVMKLF